MPLVLNTGVYPPLMETRRLVLENAGHSVITAVEDQELVEACHKYPFEVAVIGQSASPRLKQHLFSIIRRECTSAKILELVASDTGKTLGTADGWLEIPASAPDALAKRVSELATRTKGKGSA